MFPQVPHPERHTGEAINKDTSEVSDDAHVAQQAQGTQPDTVAGTMKKFKAGVPWPSLAVDVYSSTKNGKDPFLGGIYLTGEELHQVTNPYHHLLPANKLHQPSRN